MNYKMLFLSAEYYPQFNFKSSHQEIVFFDFILKTNERDCWFMTQDKNVVKLILVTQHKELICKKINVLSNYYTHPLKSSYLNIFEGKCDFESATYSYKTSDIKTKIFSVRSTDTSYIFFPLLHSYQE